MYAMKMVSAVKLKRAQSALVECRPYATVIRELFIEVLQELDLAEINHPLFQKRQEKKKLVCILSSDRGLCGSLNTNLFRFFEQNLKEYENAASSIKELSIQLVLIGKKAVEHYKRWKFPALVTVVMKKNSDEITPEDLSNFAISGYLKKEFDRVEFIFPEFKSALLQKPTCISILPFDVKSIIGSSQKALTHKSNFMFEPNPEQMMEALARRFVISQVRRIVLETQVSEHSARMMMMDQATKNADEMIENLQLLMNKVRQAGITKELADITTGVEAMA